MKNTKRAIFLILTITLLAQLVLPVFFVHPTQQGIVSVEKSRHQVVITADVCSKRLTGSISAGFFPLRPAITMLIILMVSIFSITKDRFFLPITTQKTFHPPRAW